MGEANFSFSQHDLWAKNLSEPLTDIFAERLQEQVFEVMKRIDAMTDEAIIGLLKERGIVIATKAHDEEQQRVGRDEALASVAAEIGNPLGWGRYIQQWLLERIEDPEAVDARSAMIWEEGVRTALHFAERNEDGVTLRLDRSKHPNPYEEK